MCHANNEKWKWKNDGRNRTTKSRKIKTHGEKETYKNLEADTTKQAEMKEKKLNEYFRRTRKLLGAKLYYKVINTGAVSLVRYSGPIDLKTRKLITVHKALHHENDINRLYVSRKGGRGLVSVEDSVNNSIRCLEYYIKKNKDIFMITAAKHKQRNVQQNNNKKHGKNSCRDISSDKQAKFHPRRPGYS